MNRALKVSLVLLATFLGWCLTASTQSFSGYIRMEIAAGDNLVADLFHSGGVDDLDTMMTDGVANGSTFATFNTVTRQFGPASVYNADTKTWSIDYAFAPDGQGGLLHSPTPSVVTLSGSTISVTWINFLPYMIWTPPDYAPGTYLLGDPLPIRPQTFQATVGRDPISGDSVRTLDASTQTFTTTTFNGSVWDNGAPVVDFGQSAFFTLAPEPTPGTLIGLAIATLIIFNSLRRKTARAASRPPK